MRTSGERDGAAARRGRGPNVATSEMLADDAGCAAPEVQIYSLSAFF